MRAPSNPHRRRSLLGPVAVCLVSLILSGCQIINNKWIRVRRGKSPNVTRMKLRLPNFVGPKQNVEKFFQAYKRKDWKEMESAFDKYADVYSMKDGVLLDFETYTEIDLDLVVSEPLFNSADDRARVNVEFTMEKIHRQTGSLTQMKGKGIFVLTEKGNWDILGYLGEPFWGKPKK